jgi:hypothetical protein
MLTPSATTTVEQPDEALTIYMSLFCLATREMWKTHGAAFGTLLLEERIIRGGNGAGKHAGANELFAP